MKRPTTFLVLSLSLALSLNAAVTPTPETSAATASPAPSLDTAASTPTATGNPFKIEPTLDKAIQEGLNQLYDLNFDEAEKTFAAIKEHEVEHPMVSFGKTSVHWWNLSVNVLEADEAASKKFIDSCNRTMALSKDLIKKGDPNGEGYLTLGGAQGLLGRWQAANRQWMAAYFSGKSAYQNLKLALKTNPEMNDAYMGLGMFDYYIATLPAIVRVLAFLGTKADAQEGLRQLRTAAEHGQYSNVASWLFLVNIYSTLEKKPAEALIILDKVAVEHPRSPFIHMLLIIGLYNVDSQERLNTTSADFMSRVEKGAYRAEFTTQAHFALGVARFKAKDWSGAIQEFDKGIEAARNNDPFATWAHLYRGYALDVLDKRPEAVTEYKWVLKQTRRWGSHDNAQSRLKKPFTPEDIENKTLVL